MRIELKKCDVCGAADSSRSGWSLWRGVMMDVGGNRDVFVKGAELYGSSGHYADLCPSCSKMILEFFHLLGKGEDVVH